MPTNFELVYEADAIVIGEATAFHREISIEKYDVGKFTFKILERIKGDYEATTLSDYGDTLKLDWGAPDDLGFSKGDTGLCNAYNYKVGRKYVLFLRWFKGRGHVSGPPFSRINVEVADLNAPWAQAVRRYAEVAQESDYEARKAGLKKVRERALKGEEGYPRALVKDIDAHFATATDYKSGQDLLELYNKGATEDEKRAALWAFANKKEPAAKSLMLGLLKEGAWRRYGDAVCRYAGDTRMYEAFEILAGAFPGEKDEWLRRSMLFALSELAQKKDSQRMQQILEASRANRHEPQILGKWFTKNPSTEARDYYRKLTGGDYNEGWEFALILAAMSDTEIVAWAKSNAHRQTKDRWKCFYVLALSPLESADAEIQRIIQGKDFEQMIWVAQGYEESTAPHKMERLEQIASRKNKPRKLIYWVRRTLGTALEAGDSRAAKILDRLPVVESENG